MMFESMWSVLLSCCLGSWAIAAHGGSIDGPGPVVVDGMVYFNSGYGFLGTMPGNVLLAYSADGR